MFCRGIVLFLKALFVERANPQSREFSRYPIRTNFCFIPFFLLTSLPFLAILGTFCSLALVTFISFPNPPLTPYLSHPLS